MIKDIRAIVAKGLKEYTGTPVVRGNQNADMPEYPYIAYNVTTLATENNGTYEEWDNGLNRKLITQVWSITSHSDDYAEAVALANKAREWLDRVGSVHLNDNNVVVQSVGSVTDRSTLLSVDYQYSYGFDCFFYLYDEIETDVETIDYLDTSVSKVE